MELKKIITDMDHRKVVDGKFILVVKNEVAFRRLSSSRLCDDPLGVFKKRGLRRDEATTSRRASTSNNLRAEAIKAAWLNQVIRDELQWLSLM